MSTANVVFSYSLETLDDAVTREFCRPPDQALLAIAKCPGVGDLWVIDAERSGVKDLIRGRGLAVTEETAIAGRAVTRVRPRRPLIRVPRDVAGVQEWYRTHFRDVHERIEVTDDVALLTFNPFVAAWSHAPWASRVIYYGRDDWASFEPLRPWWPAVEAAYVAIDARADAIFAVSSVLADRLSERSAVVQNGIDESKWSVSDVESYPFPPDARRPIGIYSGTVDERLDLDVVEWVMRSGVLGSLVIAGEVVDSEVERRLRATERVFELGNLHQRDLVRATRSADIGLLPHVLSSMTSAMSPLKLFEYLAAGLPVAASDMPPVRVSSRVEVCKGGGEWVEAIRRALAKGRLSESERVAVVKELSWTNRLVPVVSAVRGECLNER